MTLALIIAAWLVAAIGVVLALGRGAAMADERDADRRWEAEHGHAPELLDAGECPVCDSLVARLSDRLVREGPATAAAWMGRDPS